MSLRDQQASLMGCVYEQSDLRGANHHEATALNTIDNAQGGLSIYRRSSRLALVATLEKRFPLLATLLGKKLFNGLALGYSLSKPSNSANLSIFGERFPDYLSQVLTGAKIKTVFFSSIDTELVTQFASLENTLFKLYYAKNSGTVPLENYESNPEGLLSLRIAPQPHCQIVTSLYPLRELHALLSEHIANKTDSTTQPPPKFFAPSKESHLLVTRKINRVTLTPLKTEEVFALNFSKSKPSISKMCEEHPHFSSQLAHWITLGAIQLLLPSNA